MGNPQDIIKPGATVGERYVLQRVLGRGGFGTVYCALQAPLERPVAIKICHSTAEDRSAAVRFEREARIIGRLRSPHTVRLYDYGQTTSGFAYFAMELIHGPTLSEEISLGPLTPQRVARILAEVCESLAEAHANGVLHLDLKPGNIMVEPISGRGEITRVLDFGISRLLDAGGALESDVGAFAGTPRYMAPEHFSGGPISPQTDLFTLGLVLDECLRGTATFADPKTPLFMAKHFSAVPALPPGTPEALVHLRDHLLQVDPSDRPGSAVDVQRTLRAWSRIFESVEMPALSVLAPSEPSPHAATLDLDRSLVDQTLLMAEEPGWTLHEEETPCVVPFYANRFVGRRADLESLTKAFDDPVGRLVTLTGTGGCGKTRLAAQFAQENQRRFQGGVYFCDLSEVWGAEEIASVVAQALQVPLHIGDPLEQLGKVLKARRDCLLVLDNFEHLLEEAQSTCVRWLKAAPSSRFILTSREALRLPEERVIRVEPFSIEDGVDLFMDLAGEVAPREKYTEGQLTLVREIVQRLDGIPLAIEIAAKRLRTLSLKQLKERLTERFRLLTTRGKNLDDRRAMMWAAIDWSWSLLTETEQVVFAQCSVFRGGFSLEAAEAVIRHTAPAVDLDEVIAALVDKHLLQRASPAEGIVRFSVYESLREYAAHRLAQPASLDGDTVIHASAALPPQELLARHAAYYTGMGADEALQALTGPDGGDLMPRHILETENLKRATDYNAQAKSYEEAATCVRALLTIYTVQGPIKAGLKAIEPLLNVPLSPATRATVWSQYAWWSRGQVELAATLSAFDKADEYAAATQDPLLIARIRSGSLHFRSNQESSHAYVREYEQLLELALQAADIDTLRVVYNHMPVVLQSLGEMDRALTIYRTAYDFFVARGDRRGTARTLSHWANLCDDLGQVEEAESHYRSAMTLNVELVDRVNQGTIYGNLAFLKAAQGNHRDALAYYRTSLRIHRSVGHQGAEAYTLGNMGELYLEIGKPDDAIPLLREGITMCVKLGSQTGAGAFKAALALIYAQKGDMGRAHPLINEAVMTLGSVDSVEYGKALCKRGTIYILDQDLVSARGCLQDAETVLLEVNATGTSALGHAVARLAQAIGA